MLGIQIKNIKMRSSKLIIKSIAQKVMVDFGFECRFHNLEYLEVNFFSYSLPSL